MTHSKSVYISVVLILTGLLSNEVRGLYKALNVQTYVAASKQSDSHLQFLEEAENFSIDFIVKKEEQKFGISSYVLKENVQELLYLIPEPQSTLALQGTPLIKCVLTNGLPSQQHFMSLQLNI